MKNTILARFAHAPLVRIFGIIALTAVIVFSMSSCDPEPEEDSGNGVKDLTISIQMYLINRTGNADGSGSKVKSVIVTFGLEGDDNLGWKSLSADVVRSWFSITHASYNFTAWNVYVEDNGEFVFSTDSPDGTGAVTVTLNQDKLAEMKSYIASRVDNKPFTGNLKVGKSEASSSTWN